MSHELWAMSIIHLKTSLNIHTVEEREPSLYMRKILSILLFLVSSLTAMADLGGFYYKDIDIRAEVSIDNVWTITETETVVFQEPRHGVYRYIPETFRHDVNVAEKGEEANWQHLRYVPVLSDVDVKGWNYTTESDNGNFVLRIGDADITVTGEQTYVITYCYAFPDDRTPTYDWLYTSILGPDFNENIQHLTFSVTFEKALPADFAKALKVYCGEYGDSKTPFNGTIHVTGNTITGEASNIAPNHAVTLYAPLPEGFFEGVPEVTDETSRTAFYISLVLIAVMLFFILVARGPVIVKSIEFYPPKGVSSGEIGVIVDDVVNDIDVASMIPWLASEGYITIKEVGKDKLELTQRKPLPSDAPDYQLDIQDMLFKKGTIVRLDQLNIKPEEMETVRKNLNNIYTGSKKLVHHHNAVWLLPLLWLSSLVALWFSTPEETFSGGMLFSTLGLFTAPFVIFSFIRLSSAANLLASKTWRTVRVILKLLLMLFAMSAWLGGVTEYGYFLAEEEIMLLFIGCFAVQELIGRLVINTNYRADLMGRILGLKEFIETAEKPRLETLVHDDPEYFYRLLPYALVFGLSDKWADQFKGIVMKQPDWYQGRSDISSPLYLHSLSNSISNATSSAISTASHSGSGGSSSGGGFSGGGGFGGGGGSW